MQIRCTQCRQVFGVGDDAAGRIVHCGACGAQLRVPGPAPRPPRPAPPPAELAPEEAAADPFADLGADEPLYKRDKRFQRYSRPVGWRFFVAAGGAALGFIFGGAICGSWGLGPVALLKSLVGAVFGSLCFGFGGLVFACLVLLRLMRFVWAMNDGRFPWRYLLSFVIAGFLITAPIGALLGSAAGAEPAPGARPDDWAIGRAVIGALVGGALGALPGAVLMFLPHEKKS